MNEKHKYAIGIDFGTLSARASLVDLYENREVAVSVVAYQDEIITYSLPSTAELLPCDFFLQNPIDYVEALQALLTEIWRKGKILAEDVIGIGVGFASNTIIPLGENNMPLCMDERYRSNPHSWVKTSKHHSAQEEAEQITNLLIKKNYSLIKHCGNKVPSEWMIAKIFETFRKAPEIYHATKLFIEAGDWIVYLLTGNIRKSSCLAANKALWDSKKGYPDKDFFFQLDPGFVNIMEKVGNDVYDAGHCAGGLTARMAKQTGLPAGTPVSVAISDVLAAVPILKPKTGQSLMIMGTSIRHMALSETKIDYPICGCINQTIWKNSQRNLYCYEAVQAAAGDIYNWFIYSGIMYYYAQEMHERNVGMFPIIDEKIAKIQPGSTGLLALDWWNGNNAYPGSGKLSGLIIGMTPTTSMEEIYRALIESTAYGARKVLEDFIESGIEINEIYACGGLARKSGEVMQIFSDIIGRRINVVNVVQCSATGAALYAAVAAGKSGGGYDSFEEAMEKFSTENLMVYEPNIQYYSAYEKLFKEYCRLSDIFGQKESVMKTLKDIKESVLAQE